MELITVDRCAACSIAKNRYPDIPFRKPKLKELTDKTFTIYPTLVMDDGTKLEGLAKIVLVMDGP